MSPPLSQSSARFLFCLPFDLKVTVNKFFRNVGRSRTTQRYNSEERTLLYKFTHQNFRFVSLFSIRDHSCFIFWDITPYNPLKVNGHFGGTCRLHLQDRRISHARNEHDASSKQNSACKLLKVFLRNVGLLSTN
jgi:hypothetical protein